MLMLAKDRCQMLQAKVARCWCGAGVRVAGRRCQGRCHDTVCWNLAGGEQYVTLASALLRTRTRTSQRPLLPSASKTPSCPRPRSRGSSRDDAARLAGVEAVPQAPSRSLTRARTQPWRRASDRAGKELLNKVAPLREARRALEALASAALAATLRCSRSQELTTSLLRRVLAESAELEQLAESLRRPSSAKTAHARVVEILEEAKEANRLLGQALRAFGDGQPHDQNRSNPGMTDMRRTERPSREGAEASPASKPRPISGPEEANARCTVMAALNELVSGMRQALDDIHQLRQDAASKK
ncbi:YPTV4 [Symbiodinium pilosum]|uniref:YPTV4 protein n=1 Tax=Symbiodinium pilosum TaxID=2952 RepID=A0A812KKA7_SYMPI|nr:YPTV4 [Symbiodinium pilosum]